jgi:hypothetical protein
MGFVFAELCGGYGFAAEAIYAEMDLGWRSGDVRVVVIPHEDVDLLAAVRGDGVDVGSGGYALLRNVG